MSSFLKNKYISIIILLFLPAVVLAQLVPCTDNCGFSDLITLVNNVINFFLFDISIPLAAMLFAWAGFVMMTAGGNETKISQAKGIFGAVLWGLLIAFGAWIIVHTVLVTLGLNSDYSYLG